MRKMIVVALAAAYAMIASPSSALVGVTPVLISGCLYDDKQVCEDALSEAQNECYNSGLTPYQCTKTSEEKTLGITTSCDYTCSCQ